MNDCFYGMIGCEGNCGNCRHYYSINIHSTSQKILEYENEVEEALKPIREKYLEGVKV